MRRSSSTSQPLPNATSAIRVTRFGAAQHRVQHGQRCAQPRSPHGVASVGATACGRTPTRLATASFTRASTAGITKCVHLGGLDAVGVRQGLADRAEPTIFM